MKRILLAIGLLNCMAIVIAVSIISFPQKLLPRIEKQDSVGITSNQAVNIVYKTGIYDAFCNNYSHRKLDEFLIWINIPEYRLRFFYNSFLIDSGIISAGKHFSPTIDIYTKEITYRPFFSPTENEAGRGWKPAAPDMTFPPAKPRNPLGRRRIVLHQSFRVHGTNNEKSLGKPASNGCTRVENSAIERITDSIVKNSTVAKHYGKKGFSETYILSEPFRVIQCYRLWNFLYIEDTLLYCSIYPDIHRRLDREEFQPSFPWKKDILGNAYLKEHLLKDLNELGLFFDLDNIEDAKAFDYIWDKLKEKIRLNKNSAQKINIELPMIISNKYLVKH